MKKVCSLALLSLFISVSTVSAADDELVDVAGAFALLSQKFKMHTEGDATDTAEKLEDLLERRSSNSTLTRKFCNDTATELERKATLTEQLDYLSGLMPLVRLPALGNPTAAAQTSATPDGDEDPTITWQRELDPSNAAKNSFRVQPPQ